jgi:hypothetical protein
MNAPYCLFDPHSAFNALRATLLPHEKVRGYFYWRLTRRRRGEEQPGPSPERPPLVLRGGAPPTRLKARVTVPVIDPLPGRYTIEVALLDQPDSPAEGAPCRAFIVEQAVLDRLRARAAPAVVCREGERLTLRDLSSRQVRASIPSAPDVRTAVVLDEQRVALMTSSGEIGLWDTVCEKVDPVIGEVSAWAWGLPGEDRLPRAYQDSTGFVEPLACGMLRPSLARNDDLALAQLFDHRLLCEDFAVQQAVSALPELEGRLHGDRIVLEADLPPGCPNISDRAWVVVVVDGPIAVDGPASAGWLREAVVTSVPPGAVAP